MSTYLVVAGAGRPPVAGVDAARRSRLVAIVETLGEQAGVGIDEVIVRRESGAASTWCRGERRVLVVDPRVLGAPVDVQRRLIAHEIGHHVLGHTTGRGTRRTFGVLVATSALAVIAAGVCMALAVSGSAVRAWAAGGLAVLPFAVVGVVLVLLWARRREEVAADRLAGWLFGAPYCRAQAEWMAGAGFPDPPRWAAVVSDHPRRVTRLRRAEY